ASKETNLRNNIQLQGRMVVECFSIGTFSGGGMWKPLNMSLDNMRKKENTYLEKRMRNEVVF
ncbi:hypothetical protein ACRS7A_22755, partial [Bacillus cytotoxicus]|uniref:hypothetical protein n=1 Tax=Bacillus cytotoxicus TaxID=580165 RepID=UPI003D7DBB3A